MLYIAFAILIIAFVLFVIFKPGSTLGSPMVSKDEETDAKQILEIFIPKTDSDSSTPHTSAMAAEHLFASLHGLLQDDVSKQEHISFEIRSSATGVKFYFTAPKSVLKFVESQLYAQYPRASIKLVEDYASERSVNDIHFRVGTISFTKDHFLPIKVFRDFEVDPLANLISTLNDVKGDDRFWVQFLVKPIADGWQEEGHQYVEFVREGKAKNDPGFVGLLAKSVTKELSNIAGNIPKTVITGKPMEGENLSGAGGKDDIIKLSTFQELEVDLIENKLTKMGFEVLIRIVSTGESKERVQANLRSLAATFRQYKTASTNELRLVDRAEDKGELIKYINREFDPSGSIILNNEELATVFHLPSSREETPSVSWVLSKTGEPPAELPTDDCTFIGDTLFRGKKVRFGIKNNDDRLRHLYLIGKTGTGKSTFLINMITQDIKNGEGVGVLDPHGEAIEDILEMIPDERVDDVILFDPADAERPIGLNLLQIDDPSQKNLLASALLSAIKQHFDFSWGPRLEYLLNYALLTLLDVPGTSMLGITRLLEDSNYQKYILHFVKDPVVRRFWEVEFKEMKGNQKLVTEAIAPIQNKVNRFLASTTIRNILGQKRSTIDIWDAMNNSKILLMSLSKGKIGADNANLLGALLVSRIQFNALQRAKLRKAERKPFYLYVDEFQNFATGSFEEILSESRKYKLALHLTHQYTSQLPEELMKAVFGNVGTIATFSLGAPDARVLASEFAPYFDEEDIISLEKFHVYIKLMVNGMTSLPFSGKIILPWEEPIVPKAPNGERVREQSRQKYGTEREYVEDIINRWVERPFDKGMAIAEEARRKAHVGK